MDVYVKIPYSAKARVKETEEGLVLCLTTDDWRRALTGLAMATCEEHDKLALLDEILPDAILGRLTRLSSGPTAGSSPGSSS